MSELLLQIIVIVGYSVSLIRLMAASLMWQTNSKLASFFKSQSDTSYPSKTAKVIIA